MAAESTTYEKECLTGKKKELEALPELIDFFKTDLKPIEDRYSRFDLKGKNVFVEIKSRELLHAAYPTTIVGANKAKAAKKLVAKGCKVYFCFKFIDGLYYYEYDEKMFDDVREFKRHARSGWEDKPVEYCFIPITDLKLIKKYQVKAKREKCVRLSNGLIQCV